MFKIRSKRSRSIFLLKQSHSISSVENHLIQARMKTYERREKKVKRMQVMIQMTRAVRPSASPGVVATTELKMLTSTSRVVINRPHLGNDKNI